jgi:hypothetical protein
MRCLTMSRREFHETLLDERNVWEVAVREAGSLDRDKVIKALDHAKIAEGPGGATEMVPGQHQDRSATDNAGCCRFVR